MKDVLVDKRSVPLWVFQVPNELARQSKRPMSVRSPGKSFCELILLFPFRSFRNFTSKPRGRVERESTQRPPFD